GRSNGVMVALVQLPCRSGWPHAVRGGIRSARFCWANIVSEAPTTSSATVGTRIRRFMIDSLSSHLDRHQPERLTPSRGRKDGGRDDGPLPAIAVFRTVAAWPVARVVGVRVHATRAPRRRGRGRYSSAFSVWSA